MTITVAAMPPDQDATETKKAVDGKLKVEEESVSWLQERIRQSAALTSGMVGILSSFEERLVKLEATILPVYQETDNLRRRQENIDKTLEALDHVISFYNVSKEVEATLKTGPAAALQNHGLDHYLHTMSRLKSALDYFERHNPQSLELENVRGLFDMGGDALSREFNEMVKKHSQPLAPDDILTAVRKLDPRAAAGKADDAISVQHFFPDEVQTHLIAMAEWLSLNDYDEYMNVYAAVRASVMKKSLEQLREHLKSGSAAAVAAGSGGNGAVAVAGSGTSPRKSLLAESTPTLVNRRISKIMNSSINKRLSNVTNRIEAVARRSVGGSTPTLSYLTAAEAAGSSGGGGGGAESEVEWFCTCVSALQQLMHSDKMLMAGIIPHQYQKKMFEIISRDSMELVMRDGQEGIMAKVKKAVAASDFLFVLSVFQVVRHLMQIRVPMERTLDGCDAAVKSKYNQLVYQFFSTGSMALDGFVDSIRSDGTTKEKMPKDGTVFQLTSNVMMFLENLMDYIDTVAGILTTQDLSYNQALLRLDRKISVGERNQAVVGIYIKKVLIQLNLTLVNKSDGYSDPFLKSVFRLNNNQYILRSLQRSGIMDVVLLAEPECEENYHDMILEQKRLYSQSWARVLSFIWSAVDEIPVAILHAPGKMADKYCRIIKEKFAGFNKEMEEMAATQRSYSIPDVDLRDSLKKDNKEYICPKYQAFHAKYAHVQFTKNPDKYVKYTPAQVSSIIDTFFDDAA